MDLTLDHDDDDVLISTLLANPTSSSSAEMPPQSRYPGYANGALFRVHNGNYSEAADMEDASRPLYANKGKVPHLPVPDYDATLQLFLKSAKPHVSPEEFKQTEKCVAEMLEKNSFGRELHRRLLDRAAECNRRNTSFFIDWWNQWAYLAYRDSVVHNVTYELLLKDECASAMRNVTRRAARFVHHALAYRKQVVDGTLKPDMDAKTGLAWEASQHKYLFNCCRMPEPKADVSRTYAPDLHPHIVVARKGRFFAFDVCDANGDSMGVEAITIQLDRVVKLADAAGYDPRPVGILTADDRDVWAANRPLLLQGAGASLNDASLEKIQSAILVVCLDDAAPVTRRDVARHMLHGDGRNRFWDKSIQIAVTSNGKMAYVGEHSMTDGMTTTRFVNFVLDRMFAEPESRESTGAGAGARASSSSSSSKVYPPNSGKPLPEPTLLRFDLSDAAANAVKKAEATFDAMTKSKELEVMMWYGYGADRIKTFGVSPDAFAQMAIQLAYRLTFGHCRGTYESTQTRTYQHGRTEVTRSVSTESEALCDAVVAGAPHADIYKRLTEACAAHAAYIARASKGQGCDRHLLSLKFLVKEGEKLPALYSDPGYIRSGHWAISTSGLTGELMDGWAFGEVVPDGIGVGYSVQKARLRFSVSSAHPDQKWAARMCQNLESALVLFGDVCAAHAPKPKAAPADAAAPSTTTNKRASGTAKL